MNDSLREIKADIKDIKENHLAHIEPDMAAMKVDINWLTKFQWLIVALSVAALVTNILK